MPKYFYVAVNEKNRKYKNEMVAENAEEVRKNLRARNLNPLSVVEASRKEEEKSICCEAVLSISNEITRYVTMEDDENELYSKMKKAINNLDISTRCEELVINKFEGIPVLI